MGRLGLVALTALVGLGSGQVRAAELVAVVEAVEAGRPKVAELEPLEAGQLVALARGDRIVVGYLDSCAREVIAGPGAVRIGTSVSRLEGASLVDRRTVDCHGSPLAGISSGDGAATRVRGVGPAVGRVGTPQHALASLRTMRDRQAPGLAPHRLPVLLLQDPAQQVVLVPLEAQGQPRRLPGRQGAGRSCRGLRHRAAGIRALAGPARCRGTDLHRPRRRARWPGTAQRAHRRLLSARLRLLVLLLAALLGLALAESPAGAGLDRRFQDLARLLKARLAPGPERGHGKIVVVALDEESHLRPPFADLPRPLWTPQLASVVEAALDAGALVVGLDLILATSAEPVLRGYDRPLLQALRRGGDEGRLVLASVQDPHRPLYPAPIYVFALRRNADHIRPANLAPDPDGVARRAMLRLSDGSLGFGAEIARRAGAADPGCGWTAPRPRCGPGAGGDALLRRCPCLRRGRAQRDPAALLRRAGGADRQHALRRGPVPRRQLAGGEPVPRRSRTSAAPTPLRSAACPRRRPGPWRACSSRR